MAAVGFVAMDTITTAIRTIDETMMQRCIQLSREVGREGEMPFASVVCQGEHIVAEAVNRVMRDADVTRHAELMALQKAQKALGRNDLSACTIYSNVEPCAMCSFPIRETRIGRVVFAIRSPLMGGFSKFGVVRDNVMSDVMPEFFGDPPEVVAGLLAEEAEQAWSDFNPIIWAVIRYRGCFGGVTSGDELCTHGHPPARLRRLNWRQIAQSLISRRR